VSYAASRELERRGVHGFAEPMTVRWEPPADAARSIADQVLDMVLSATTVVFNARRSAHAAEMRDVWHDLMVQLAELRDQRRLERRWMDDLLLQAHGYRGRGEAA
jgi:hypothetical protein